MNHNEENSMEMSQTEASEMESAEESIPMDSAVEEGVSRLIAVVDQAVAKISDEAERSLVREGVATVVRETLYELATQSAERQSFAMVNNDPIQPIGDSAQAAINVAKQVKDIGFVEFTAGLITGTFDSIIGATVKQMEAYAKLVADLAKTLTQFQAENITDAQVNAHLAGRYPDGNGGTVVSPIHEFEEIPANPETGAAGKSVQDQIKEVVAALVTETRKLKEADRLTPEQFPIDAKTVKFTQSQVELIRKAISLMLATTMMEHLRAMAREGMARIVISEGEIHTKLTFDVSSTEIDNKRKDDFHRDSAGAYIRGSAWAGWGTISAGGNWNQLNVKTVNQSTHDNLTMSAEMIGEVKLKFRTESFPPITTTSA